MGGSPIGGGSNPGPATWPEKTGARGLIQKIELIEKFLYFFVDKCFTPNYYAYLKAVNP